MAFIYRIPLFGEFTSQNAIMAERFIEGGSPYVHNSTLHEHFLSLYAYIPLLPCMSFFSFVEKIVDELRLGSLSACPLRGMC